MVGLVLGSITDTTITYTYTDDYLMEMMLCGEAFGIVEESGDVLIENEEMLEFCKEIIKELKIIECVDCIKI